MELGNIIFIAISLVISVIGFDNMVAYIAILICLSTFYVAAALTALYLSGRDWAKVAIKMLYDGATLWYEIVLLPFIAFVDKDELLSHLLAHRRHRPVALSDEEWTKLSAIDKHELPDVLLMDANELRNLLGRDRQQETADKFQNRLE